MMYLFMQITMLISNALLYQSLTDFLWDIDILLQFDNTFVIR